MPLESDKLPNYSSGDPTREGGRLGMLLAAGRWLVDADRDDKLLPYWSVEGDTSEHRPGAIEQAWQRLSIRLKNDPSRNECFQEMKQRQTDGSVADKMETDLLAHFIKISGHSQEDLTRLREDERQFPPTPAPDVANSESRAPFRVIRRFTVRKESLIGPLLVMYILILTISRPASTLSVTVLDPEVQTIAWLNLGETSRGGQEIWELEMKANYQQALTQIRQSRTSILGLFPGYDRNELSDAADRLERAISFQGQREISSSKAILLLAQARWHLGRKQEARDLLQIVSNRDDGDTHMAGDVLEKLENR